MLKKLFFVLYLIFPTLLLGQIERVEPAFWWVGMKNPQLQLLIHGKDICTRKVHINYSGVQILHVNRACSPNYLFVTLRIDPRKTQAGTFPIVLSEKGSADLTYNYALKLRKPGSALRHGFGSEDVLYLLMPDRFANGDLTNDQVDREPEKVNRSNPSGRHGGDIKGIAEHLDYIKELGATAVWATPLLENNYPEYSYHGYAISDIYQVDPRFGTNQDYANLVQQAHHKGLKFIMDIVSNHGGLNAWWMNDLPFEDWIHQWPTLTYTNHKAITMKDIHAAELDKKKYSDGWFDKTMPDMNQNNAYFMNWYTQNCIWWIEYSDLDGLRMDTYAYNDRDAMARWARAILTEYPDFNIVGETWLFTSQDIAFWQRNSSNTLKYNSYLPTVMDFTLEKALQTCFDEHGKPWEDAGMNRLYACLANDYLYSDPNRILIFAENHDSPRFHYLYKNNLAQYKMAMIYLLTMRGIPQLYYGTEIGMTGNKDLSDGDIRRDFPGGWPGDPQNAFECSSRTSEQKAYFDFLSTLLHWRKSKSVIHQGKMIHYVPDDDVYVYFRYNENERVMVVMNNNKTPKVLSTSRYSQMLDGYKSATDVLTGQSVNVTDSLKLEAQTAYIYELNDNKK